MGSIISSKINSKNKFVIKLLIKNEEMLHLKNHLKNVRLFNPELCIHESEINTRGNNGVTKYFKIPLSMRSRKKQSGSLSYQKLDTPSKIFYIYTLEKDKFEN